VQLERGSLFVNIEKNEAILTGPAEISFYGSIEN
jgi:diaminopimelate epimerase